MSLKARVRTDCLGNITIHMEGGLDIDQCLPLKSELISIMEANPHSIVTLDLHSLDFVGSSGIGHFVDTIKGLNQIKDQIRLTNVKTEFLKVFKLYNFDAMNVLIDQFDDDLTENLSQKFAGRTRTFEN